jgi:hypothetical protein
MGTRGSSLNLCEKRSQVDCWRGGGAATEDSQVSVGVGVGV